MRRCWKEGSSAPQASTPSLPPLSPSQAALQLVSPGASPWTSGTPKLRTAAWVYTKPLLSKTKNPGCFPLKQTGSRLSASSQHGAAFRFWAYGVRLHPSASPQHRVQDPACSIRRPMLTPALGSGSTPKFPETHLFHQMHSGWFCCCFWKNLGFC